MFSREKTEQNLTIELRTKYKPDPKKGHGYRDRIYGVLSLDSLRTDQYILDMKVQDMVHIIYI